VHVAVADLEDEEHVQTLKCQRAVHLEESHAGIVDAWVRRDWQSPETVET
jgi:hypothetical protein